MAGKKIYFGILLTIFGVSVARLVVLYSNDTTQLLQSHDDTTQQQKMRGNVSRFGVVPKPRKEVFNTKHQACHAW